jgi:hypothetical protein
MATHTHRGHCQLCLRVHAIDTTTGLIAKHGYTVAGYGFFNGVCPESEKPSLHIARDRTDYYIAQAYADADRAERKAEALTALTIDPGPNIWNGEYKIVECPLRGRYRANVEVPYSEALPYYQTMARTEEVHDLTRHAKNARNWAAERQKWADRITGKVDAYRVTDLEPRDWQVGDAVRVGGKKGHTLLIQEIKELPMRSRGWSHRSAVINVKHAAFTWPEYTKKEYNAESNRYVDVKVPTHTIWEPLRNLKRQPNTLATELKEAGLL